MISWLRKHLKRNTNGVVRKGWLYSWGGLKADVYYKSDGQYHGIVRDTYGLITFIAEDTQYIEARFQEAVVAWRSLSMRKLKEVRRGLDRKKSQ